MVNAFQGGEFERSTKRNLNDNLQWAKTKFYLDKYTYRHVFSQPKAARKSELQTNKSSVIFSWFKNLESQ